MESGVAPLGVIRVPWMKLDQTSHLFFGCFNGFLKDYLPCFVKSICVKMRRQICYLWFIKLYPHNINPTFLPNILGYDGSSNFIGKR
jgi:hypothetical protein